MSIRETLLHVTTEPDHDMARLRMLASLLRWHEGSISAYLSSSSFVIGVLAWEGFDVTAKESGLMSDDGRYDCRA